MQSVHGATRKMLLRIKGFSEMKVEKVKEAITKLLVGTEHLRSLIFYLRMRNAVLYLDRPADIWDFSQANRQRVHDGYGVRPSTQTRCQNIHWE